MSWPWSQLGLPGPSGLSEVRHAYAEKLKTTHPEEDPEGFQRLHSAYQLASRMARQQKRQAETRAPEPQPERPAPPQPEPPHPQEEFDFDELLKEGETPSRPPRGPEEEQDFDFDELLETGETPPRPPEEEEQDFDFERLFAEGEAERAEARRRRGEERRREQAGRSQERKNQWKRREEELNLRFRRNEERWQGTEAILHTIEMLYNARAGAEEWEKFFASPLFQQNKNSIDLIFGLEDFVSVKSLSQEVKLALFLAYGFDKGVSRPELRPLFQMLLPAWKEHKKADRFQSSSMLWGLGGAVVFFIVIGPILEFGILSTILVALGAGWIIWALREVVRLGSIEKRARGQTVSRKQERLTMARAVLAVAAVVIVLSLSRGVEFSKLLDRFLPARDPREQTCRYIEQDFGVKVHALYNLSDAYATETYGNVFYVGEDPYSHRFLAGPDGDRDTKNGKAGYATNLPQMLLLWRLREFAREHHLVGMDAADKEQKVKEWETTGVYRIPLPIEDGEDIIRDLGELAEELKQEKWYKLLMHTKCSVTLCSEEMEEGWIVLIRWHPGLEVYSTEQHLEIYEETFAHKCCAQIIRELGLDWDFIREEGEHYTLTNEGKAVIRGTECFKLFGLDENGEVAMEYYVYPKLRNIYCFPGNFWETGNTEDQLGFYRLLYWGDRGTFNLFYPWLRVN